jgi:hypothetical protein
MKLKPNTIAYGPIGAMGTPFTHTRIPRAPEGDDGGGSSDPPAADPPASNDPTPAEAIAAYQQQKEIVEDLKKQIAAMTDKGASQADKLKAAEEAQAKVDEAVAKLDAEVKKYIERDQKRADEIYTGLPEDAQKRLAPIKDKLPLDTWLAYLEEEKIAADTAKGNPGTGKPPLRGDKRSGRSKEFRPDPDTYDTLQEGLGMEVKFLPTMNVNRDRAGFTASIPFKDHLKYIKGQTVRPEPMTPEHARDRGPAPNLGPRPEGPDDR